MQARYCRSSIACSSGSLCAGHTGWKALVNSIQKDRRRLEEESDEFEVRIRKANDKIIKLEAEADCLKQQLDPAQRADREQAEANGHPQDAQSAAHIAAVMKKLEESRDGERQVGPWSLLCVGTRKLTYA